MYTATDIETAFHSFSHFKHGEFREYQSEAIQKIANSKLSVFVLVGPTGTGKTILGTTLIKLFKNGVYLVHSKALQEQLKYDFPEFKLLFGRSNYSCIDDPDSEMSCADCVYQHPEESCQHYKDCTYRLAKMRTAIHPLRCLNYTYFLYVNNFTSDGLFADKPIVICDEADKLENELLNFIKIEVSENQIKKWKLDPPRYITATAQKGIPSWIDWTSNCLEKIEKRISRLSDKAPKKDLERLEGFKFKLEVFLDIVDDTWLFENRKTSKGYRWSFMPTWLTPEMTDRFFRNYCGKLVLMSAKLPPPEVLSQKLGIPLEEMDYMEVPSTWDKENRPIKFLPVLSISHKTEDEELEKLKPIVRGILDKHKNHKGLIHTSSYRYATFIMGIDDKRLITHNPENKMEKLEYFKRSKQPLVMVSPSMDRGISLDDELCRFIILIKALYLDLSDKQTSTRLYSSEAGKLWYSAECVQNVEQACGRGVRHKDDYCHIYLLDRKIMDLHDTKPELFSKYFKENIEW